jgi:hypothetical protein
MGKAERNRGRWRSRPRASRVFPMISGTTLLSAVRSIIYTGPYGERWRRVVTGGYLLQRLGLPAELGGASK